MSWNKGLDSSDPRVKANNEAIRKAKSTVEAKMKACPTKFRRTTKPKSLMEISSRTASKILTRMKAACSKCGWNEARCDLHHILPKKQGGTDEHGNLTYLCPNCHRIAHERKQTEGFVSLDEQIGDSWLEHYYGC